MTSNKPFESSKSKIIAEEEAQELKSFSMVDMSAEKSKKEKSRSKKEKKEKKEKKRKKGDKSYNNQDIIIAD